jgi:outer membrane protein TolC
MIHGGRNDSWSTILSLNIPLWNQLSSRSEVAAQYAAYEQAAGAFTMAEAEEIAKREAATQKISLLAETVRATEIILKKSEQLYESALDAFRAGRISAYDLFLEQSRIIESKHELSQGKFGLHQALVEDCLLGGMSLRECLIPAPVAGGR